MNHPNYNKIYLTIVSGVLFTSLVGAAFGAPLLFTVDSSQSSITASGSFGGAPITEQGTASLVTTFNGSVDLDLDDQLNPTSVTITGLSLDALVNGQWSPGVGGGPGTADADVAGEVASLPFFSLQVAVRDLMVSGSTPSVVPVAGGQFDTTSLLFTLDGANVDYSGTLLGSPTSGTTSLSALSSNNIAGSASLTYSNNTATLSIPIDFTVSKSVLSQPLVLRNVGVLIATATVGTDTNQPNIQCSLAPTTATNFVGTSHAVTATVYSNGVPVSGVTVDFEVTGGPNLGATNSVPTDSNGEAVFIYNSNGTPGTDAISATGTVSSLGFSCAAEKTWEASVGCVLVPTDVTNLVGEAHSVTITVTSNGAPAQDITVDFSVTSGPNVGSNTVAVTDVNGQALFDYVSNGVPGTDSISATGSVGLVSFDCSASKVWVAAPPPEIECILEPASATNLVGTTHTVTVTVTSNGFAVVGESVDFLVTAGPNIGSGASLATDGNGQAVFPYTSNGTPGTDTIAATGTVSSVPFACVATKLWVAPSLVDLSVTKTDAPDPIKALSNLTYTVRIVNLGTTDATSVELDDMFPDDMTYVSSAASQGSCSESATGVTCDLGTLGVAQTATVTIVAIPEFGGVITNTATVSSEEEDINPSNNVAIAVTTVQGLPDLTPTIEDQVISCSEVAPLPCNLSGVLTLSNRGSAFASAAMELLATCKKCPDSVAWKLSGTMDVSLINLSDIPDHTLAIYLSDDDELDPDDLLLTAKPITLASLTKAFNKGKPLKVKAKVPKDTNLTGMYLLFVEDNGGVVTEGNEDDNVAAFGPIE